MTPSKADIEKAKAYLRQRLDAELRMEHYLDSVLVKAAREIVELAYKRSIPPTLFSFNYDPFMAAEIDRVIKKLTAQIEEYDFLMATSTPKSDKDKLLPYINREIDGITYSERLSNYTSRFKLELQDYIAAGLALGLSKQAAAREIVRTYKKPYWGTIISDREHRGTSSYTRLLLLVRYTIADAWMHADMEQALRSGAIGFYSYRGSSYPCAECDDHAGRFHTFAEPYPPYHVNCKCYAVPIYK